MKPGVAVAAKEEKEFLTAENAENTKRDLFARHPGGCQRPAFGERSRKSHIATIDSSAHGD
jgi:hypothetical protein